MSNIQVNASLKQAIGRYINLFWEPDFKADHPVVETVDRIENVEVQRVMVKKDLLFGWQGMDRAKGNSLIYWLKGKGLFSEDKHEHQMFSGILLELTPGVIYSAATQEDSIFLMLNIHRG
jgi:hypothetical protein